jgi:hypothetical protein
MTDDDADDLLLPLRQLKRVAPDPQSTAAAVRRARKTLSRRRLMRWTFGSLTAAAAAVVLVIGFGWLSPAGNRASAAEALAEAAGVSKAYKGWVHTRMSSPGEKKPFSVTHYNNDTGASATETRDGDAFEIEMDVPAERLEVKYSSEDNTVRIGEVWEQFAENWRKLMQRTPLTAAETLPKVPDADVKESKDGDLVRYDVRTKGSKDVHTIWADSKTKLIVKGVDRSDGQTVEFLVTYGEPAIRDVYDLGVPRTAKVLDARPPKDASQLLARLQRRVEEGFGDHVAILTEQDTDKDGKPTSAGGAIWLFARRGKTSYVGNRYLTGDPKEREAGQFPVAKVPPGWPTPTLEAALASAAELPPTNFLVSDGKHAWRGYAMNPGKFFVHDLTGPEGSQMVPSALAHDSFPGQVWRTRVAMGAFGADAKFKLIKDPKEPNVICLELDQVYPGPEMKPTRGIERHWIDVAKDDMPLRELHATYVGTSDKEYLKFETQYSAYAKTAGGRWYPTEWKTVTTMTPPSVEKSYMTTRAQLWTDRGIDDKWFRKPEGIKVVRQGE